MYFYAATLVFDLGSGQSPHLYVVDKNNYYLHRDSSNFEFYLYNHIF